MTKEELLELICPTDAIDDCCRAEGNVSCDNCEKTLTVWLDDYAQQIRAEAIDDVLKLERLNHYDMCEELMYQSIKADDIEKLKGQE